MIRNVNTIFLMLGYDCNLSCIYCMQQDERQASIAKPMDIPKVVGYIEDIASRQIDPVTIHFYGGEPLLYFDVIKNIVEKVEHINNVRFSLITNGVLLTSGMVDYINLHNIYPCISWDGKNVLTTRGVDVLKDNTDNILRLNNLQVSAVLSSYNYFDDIFDYLEPYQRLYRQMHGNNPDDTSVGGIAINIDLIQQYGKVNESLFNIDLNKINTQMTSMIDEFVKYLNGEDHKELQAKYIAFLIRRAKGVVERQFRNSEYKASMAYCHNGYTTLNLDLSGNLYQCHNFENSFVGTIGDSYDYILENVIGFDNTKELCKSLCKDCNVVCLCECGCPQVSPEDKNRTWCPLHKAVYQPVLNYMLSLNENNMTASNDPNNILKY